MDDRPHVRTMGTRATPRARVQIADMRWLVLLALREQIPDSGTSILESLVNPIKVHAKIEELYPQTFYLAAQTDRPVTHLISMRWVGWLDQRFVIIRVTQMPNSTPRADVFRIRRVKELDGRKQFLEIEAELETRQ